MILLTNDDGIYAPGLWALAQALEDEEIIIVAPDREQSAVGTSITLHNPLRIKEIKNTPVPGIKTFSVEGTPADSVILAIRYLARDKIRLVISGINEGANLGNDVFISGTVGAALQGYFYNIPSIALSVGSYKNPRFDVASKFAKLMVRENLLPHGFLLNINFPNLPLDEIEGVEITRLGVRSYMDEIKKGHDGKREYYWIVRGEPVWDEIPGTDIWAVRRKRISITPLRYSFDFENFELEEEFKEIFLRLKNEGGKGRDSRV